MPQQPKGMRRVVTGAAPDGRSVVVSDDRVAPITISLMPGGAFFDLWGDDAPPAFPDAGARAPYRGWFPGPEGYRFEVITIPPDGTPKPAGFDPASAMAEAAARLPGLLESMDKDHPGMHRTDTVDLIHILSGRCLLNLDGGEEVTLEPGDSLVQNGTRHGWKVPFDEPCTMLCVSIGGVRKA